MWSLLSRRSPREKVLRDSELAIEFASSNRLRSSLSATHGRHHVRLSQELRLVALCFTHALDLERDRIHRLLQSLEARIMLGAHFHFASTAAAASPAERAPHVDRPDRHENHRRKRKAPFGVVCSIS